MIKAHYLRGFDKSLVLLTCGLDAPVLLPTKAPYLIFLKAKYPPTIAAMIMKMTSSTTPVGELVSPFSMLPALHNVVKEMYTV